MNPTIPFVDLRAQHEQVRPAIEAAIRDIIDRSSFIGGSYVAAFEREFAEYIGVKEAIGVANGTDALWLALIALGVGPGDAVITVPNTFIATVEAITRAGAWPLFVDIDPATATLDPALLETFLETRCRLQDDGRLIHLPSGRRVAAILPVHLYGLPFDVKPILDLANACHVPLVEDAAQAQGARYRLDGAWRRAGSFGRAAGFSFYPGKNLGAMGDAGAVTTNDPELAEKIRWLRDHGSCEKYVHVTPHGWNSRLDAIQAAVLSIKLKKLDEWNAQRRRVAAWYSQALGGLPLELPCAPPWAEHIYHLYVVRTPERDRLYKELLARGVGVGLHYPIPLHLQRAYAHLNLPPGAFPRSEESARTLLSLPMHPALTETQVQRVAQACAEILEPQPQPVP